MSFGNMLYTLIIGPLELFFEVIYAFACILTMNAGLAIVFLSLAINILVLPLYRRADAMQLEEQEMEKRLKPGVAHIKKTFQGDERFMMLQTFYRQNHYKPTHVLKGSITLLLEIPFFLAAYNFLSGLEMLHGISFGPIRDLGAPDGMLVLGGVTVNVLPILMTVINLISSAIYTKDANLRGKIQLYVMAGLFLVLLYQSPSGLVFYWTLNNLFSLLKNLYHQIKWRDKAAAVIKKNLSIALSAGGIVATVIILFFANIPSTTMRIMISVFLLVAQIPLAVRTLRKKRKILPVKEEVTKKDTAVFVSGCLLMTLVTGLWIPTAVIGASPAEFMGFEHQINPLTPVLHSLLIAAGIFLLWFGIFYVLAKPQGKKHMGLIMWLGSVVAVVNFLFFGTRYGNLSATLKYESALMIGMESMMINMAVLVAVVALWVLVWKKRAEVVRFVYVVACLAVLAVSVLNVQKIYTVSHSAGEELNSVAEDVPEFNLSRNGKNVIVLMMDRAISGYVPYMFREKPELQQQFSGFTYYPNTISFGGSTNFGSPALYGGYEYTPVEMNKRDQEKLVVKHNEALKIMPSIFDQADFDVTVCDPSYAGYSWIPDLSIYDDYPDIKTHITLGRFNLPEFEGGTEEVLNRNLFCYSIFRCSPLFLQPAMYANGTYNKLGATGGQIVSNTHLANGTSPVFNSSYAVLKNLEGMTHITDQEENTFLMMSNDTTHSPALLHEPSYEPSDRVDNREYDAAHTDRFDLNGRHMNMITEPQVMHYQVNMATMLQLGKWFDYLKAQGVYDNTRIILASDHGYKLQQFDDMMLEDEDLMRFHPLLMVKDFGAEGFTTDDRFMTNADVPTLAFAGLVPNPKNPFTGKPISSAPKFSGAQYVIRSGEWDTSVNDGNTFMESQWLTVHDNIFEQDNWAMVD